MEVCKEIEISRINSNNMYKTIHESFLIHINSILWMFNSR